MVLSPLSVFCMGAGHPGTRLFLAEDVEWMLFCLRRCRVEPALLSGWWMAKPALRWFVGQTSFNVSGGQTSVAIAYDTVMRTGPIHGNLQPNKEPWIGDAAAATSGCVMRIENDAVCHLAKAVIQARARTCGWRLPNSWRHHSIIHR